MLLPAVTSGAPIRKQLKRGAIVVAAEDIHFSGDGTLIPAGTQGKVVTSGRLACNVHFSGYPDCHYVLCLWTMLRANPNQPSNGKDIQNLPGMQTPR